MKKGSVIEPLHLRIFVDAITMRSMRHLLVFQAVRDPELPMKGSSFAALYSIRWIIHEPPFISFPADFAGAFA
jgi:hypothetical protein